MTIETPTFDRSASGITGGSPDVKGQQLALRHYGATEASTGAPRLTRVSSDAPARTVQPRMSTAERPPGTAPPDLPTGGAADFTLLETIMKAPDRRSPKVQGVWARIWAVWLVVIAATFAVLEGIALVRRQPGDTLSENTRHWLGTDRTWKTWGAFGFVAALVGFVVWFVPHIAFNAW